MGKLGDILSQDKQELIYKKTVNVGDVFLKNFDGISHKKYFIVVGMSKDKITICSVFINSEINQYVKTRKPHLIRLHVPLSKQNNNFLKYDSYGDCSAIIPSTVEKISEQIARKECQIIGNIFEKDLFLLQKTLVSSGLLSEYEIELYFPEI